MPKLMEDRIDVTSLSTELSVEDKVEVKEEPATPTEPTPKVEEKIESLETLSEKSDDRVPLNKYMSEKNARKESEAKAKELEAELTKLRENPYKSNQDVKIDVSALSEKHGIDQEVLTDILNASYSMTKSKVREELEEELKPILAESAQNKKQKEQEAFDTKFNSVVNKALEEMPEYANLVDKEDIKSWIVSGKYSKLSVSELIEQKYGKFVAGKKTIETAHASKQVEMPDASKPLSDEDMLRLDKDPELRKKWADGLQDRLKKYM